MPERRVGTRVAQASASSRSGRGQPLQAVEPDERGQLHARPGAGGGDTKGSWGRVRVLGVPSVADRIAQTAAARLLEEKLEPIFHPDSYGYRPGRSARDALAVTRKRCWKQDWDWILISGFESMVTLLLC